MLAAAKSSFVSVYGPVDSWRYGRSLGVDPIGSISTCSFDCVYCQLGKIECQTSDRQIFVSTEQILQDLQLFAPWDVDAITLSGSGEPTLALNLGEILACIKTVTHRTVGVLTNGSLLKDTAVQEELAIADQVAIKIDAVTDDQLRRVNRPIAGINISEVWAGIKQFCRHYPGQLAIQTMILAPWGEAEKTRYIALLNELVPDEVQLNIPTRPCPLTHQLNARGNHPANADLGEVRELNTVNSKVMTALRDRIQRETGLSVRCAPVKGKGKSRG